jgi:hypothetical protein
MRSEMAWSSAFNSHHVLKCNLTGGRRANSQRQLGPAFETILPFSLSSASPTLPYVPIAMDKMDNDFACNDVKPSLISKCLTIWPSLLDTLVTWPACMALLSPLQLERSQPINDIVRPQTRLSRGLCWRLLAEDNLEAGIMHPSIPAGLPNSLQASFSEFSRKFTSNL